MRTHTALKKRLGGLIAGVTLVVGSVLGVAAPVQAAPGCTGPGDAAGLAAALAGASDGETITLCTTIDAPSAGPALAAATGVSVTLDLNGYELDTTGAENFAGLEVGPTSEITIVDGAGGGQLIATGGKWAAGIGGNLWSDSGTITVDGGKVVAYGGGYAAGIGGGHMGANGTVTVNGGDVTAVGSSDPFSDAAGIGGGTNAASGMIVITGGTVSATGWGQGAGIGSGGLYGGGARGDVVISGGSVTAQGGSDGGSGIGSSSNRGFNAIAISGGTVTATGGAGAAGIGGGSYGGCPRSVTIAAATVTATGGSGGPGIGGGFWAACGMALAIDSGTVTATGSNQAAAIGSGPGGDGGAVAIGAGAVVTVRADGDTNVIGQGVGSGSFGSLSNAGSLTITSGSVLTIPDGVTVTNAGTLITEHGSPNGAVVNNGVIVNTGTVTTPDDITVHNYVLAFDLNGAPGTAPDAARVYAPTPGDGQVALPADPSRDGFSFAGWNAMADGSGTTLSQTSDLTTTGDGPRTLEFYAQWKALPPLLVTTTALPAGTAGAPYQAHLLASGGADDAYTWKLESGQLPPGLTLRADGTIEGTPSAAGTFSFTVSVNDPAYADLTIAIGPAAASPETPPEAPPEILPVTGAPSQVQLLAAIILVIAGLGVLWGRQRRWV